MNDQANFAKMLNSWEDSIVQSKADRLRLMLSESITSADFRGDFSPWLGDSPHGFPLAQMKEIAKATVVACYTS